jgi:cytoskeletal protein RodZ
MITLDKFAEELREKREALGISINDIYEITRIDKNYLEAMEKGNFEVMPDVYMRAFIRKFAEAVELNPDEVIKKYEAAKSGKGFNETVIIEKEEGSEIIDEQESGKKSMDNDVYESKISEKINNPFLILGSIGAIIIIAIVYFTFISSDSDEIIREQKVEDILTERKNEVETPRFEIKKNEPVVEKNQKPEVETIITTSDSLSLKINSLDTVWFRTKIDNAESDEFILNPNRSKTLSAKSKINMLVGNAGGLELILNGKKLNFIGKKGEIKNISIDSDGIHYLKMRPDSTNE